jgi:hypothetical protein
VKTMLAGSGIAVLAFVVAIGAPGASAQVRPYTPPTSVSGGGRGAIGALLPSDVEIRAEATERLAKYKPDPVKYPVPRTKWDGKPWLGGGRGSQLPQTSSDALRIVERWSRPDGQTFDYEATVEDTNMLTAPWTGPVRRRALLPYDMIQESPCALDSELYARHLEYAAAEAARKKGASVR